jgi:TatA/E family protein of Tat protein translocase
MTGRQLKSKVARAAIVPQPPRVLAALEKAAQGAKNMPWGLTPAHLIIILVIVLIVVGPGKLPDTGAAIGKALRGFKDAMETGEVPQQNQQPPQPNQLSQPPAQQPYPPQYPPQQYPGQYPPQQYGQQPMPPQYGQQPMPPQYGQQPMPPQYGQPPMGPQYPPQQAAPTQEEPPKQG